MITTIVLDISYSCTYRLQRVATFPICSKPSRWKICCSQDHKLFHAVIKRYRATSMERQVAQSRAFPSPTLRKFRRTVRYEYKLLKRRSIALNLLGSNHNLCRRRHQTTLFAVCVGNVRNECATTIKYCSRPNSPKPTIN